MERKFVAERIYDSSRFPFSSYDSCLTSQGCQEYCYLITARVTHARRGVPKRRAASRITSRNICSKSVRATRSRRRTCVYRVRNEIESISRDVIANADMISRECLAIGIGRSTHELQKWHSRYGCTRVFVCNSYTYVERKRRRGRERERETNSRKKAFANRERHDRDTVSVWHSE